MVNTQIKVEGSKYMPASNPMLTGHVTRRRDQGGYILSVITR